MSNRQVAKSQNHCDGCYNVISIWKLTGDSQAVIHHWKRWQWCSLRLILNASPPGTKTAATSHTTLSGVTSWIKSLVFWFKFHWRLFPRVQLITLIQIKAWRRISDEPLSEPMLNGFSDAYMHHRWGSVDVYQPPARVESATSQLFDVYLLHLTHQRFRQ